MEEEFYSIIKLVSGEEIISLVSIDENDGDPLVVLQNPITMKMIETSHGIHIKVKSWMELSSDNFFIIRPDKIITMTETKDERLIEVYTNYIEDDDSIEVHRPSGKTKPSRKMGYVSSVEDARKQLESLYNLKDTKES
jgi:hypothetical protein